MSRIIHAQCIQHLQQIADIYEAPVLYKDDFYEVNLRYDEFQKKCALLHVKQKLYKLGLIKDGHVTITIKGSGF